MSKKDDKCDETVLNYLINNNRPYCINDILNNLHNQFSKSAISRTLDSLVANKLVKEKIYGKQKIYYANQDNFDDFNKEELKEVECKIAILSVEKEKLESTLKIKESELIKLNSIPNLKQLEASIIENDQEISELEKRLNICKQHSLDPLEMRKIKEDYRKLSSEFRKRKRAAKEAFDAISEGYPDGEESLREIIGYENDNFMPKY